MPIEDIPPDTKLVDLSAPEEQGVCDWGKDVARGKLPAPGSAMDCDGITITFNETECGFPATAQSGCEATVAEWQVCFPEFVDALAEDPCLILDFAFSAEDLEAFVNAIPGCEGMGPCSYTTN